MPPNLFAGAEEMFADYCRADLWHVVGAHQRVPPRLCLSSCASLSSLSLRTESPPARSSVAFVRAENGGLPLHSSLHRLDKALGNKSVACDEFGAHCVLTTKASRSHLLGKCGHWLHVDNPDGAMRMHATRCEPTAAPDSRNQDSLKYCDQA